MYVCRYVCIYVCMYVCMYVGVYVCMCACLSVCLSSHAILAVHVIKSIMKDTIIKHQICGNIKKVFFLKIVLFEG